MYDIVIYCDDVSLFEQRGTRNMKSHTYSHSRVDIPKKGCVKFGGGAASFCRAYVWGRVLRCGEEMALLQLQHAMTHFDHLHHFSVFRYPQFLPVFGLTSVLSASVCCMLRTSDGSAGAWQRQKNCQRVSQRINHDVCRT